MLSPIFFFKGIDNYDPHVDVHFNKKAYCNERTAVKYITEKPVAGATCRCQWRLPVESWDFEPQPRCQEPELGKAGLIALNAAKFHRTALVKETFYYSLPYSWWDYGFVSFQ